MTTATTANPIRLPAELKPELVTVIVDSREQLAWDVSPLRSEIGTLAAGDYSIRGLENVIALERKSLADFVSCCGNERERFEKEVQRLLSYPARAIVIEASWSDLERGEWRSKISAKSVVTSAVGWISVGCPVVLIGGREQAETFAKRFLFISARRRFRECRALVNDVFSKGS